MLGSSPSQDFPLSRATFSDSLLALPWAGVQDRKLWLLPLNAEVNDTHAYSGSDCSNFNHSCLKYSRSPTCWLTYITCRRTKTVRLHCGLNDLCLTLLPEM